MKTKQKKKYNKNKGPSETATLYIRTLPRTVKNRFKSWCDLHGLTMTQAMTEIMREVDRNPDFVPPRLINLIKESA